jgi:hypothetical protein
MPYQAAIVAALVLGAVHRHRHPFIALLLLVVIVGGAVYYFMRRRRLAQERESSRG